MRYIFVTFFFLFIPLFCFSSEIERLIIVDCPVRGRIEITLHKFSHTDELWHNGFEVGSGIKNKNGYTIVDFVNGDEFYFNPSLGRFLFKFYTGKKVYPCQLLDNKKTITTKLDYIK